MLSITQELGICVQEGKLLHRQPNTFVEAMQPAFNNIERLRCIIKILMPMINKKGKDKIPRIPSSPYSKVWRC